MLNSGVRQQNYLMIVIAVAAGLLALRLAAQAPPAQEANASAEFSRAVRPFLSENCLRCHNTGLPSGNIDLEQLLAMPNSVAQRRDVWENVAYQIRSGAMPPPGAPKPAKAAADAAL